MDIDNLQNEWKTIDVTDANVCDVERDVMLGRCTHTLRDRLLRINRRQRLVCLAGALCMLPLMHDDTLLVILSVLFFIIMAVFQVIQMRYLKAVDPSRSTVRESMANVVRIETLLSFKRAFGIATGVPLVIYMFMTVGSYSMYMLPSCLAGMVLGIVIGIVVNRRITRILREMKSELSEDFSAA